MKRRIGLAVITYNRPDVLEDCLNHLDDNLWGGAHIKVIIVDEPYSQKYKNVREEMIFADRNRGVANAKNRAIRALIAEGADHIFLMEDDIKMLSPSTCEKYIEYAKEKSLHHLNFAHHGGYNKNMSFYYKGINTYPGCPGAFSYYSRECIEKIGLMDEEFHNALEHLEHTYRISKNGYTTPFYYFADHPDSESMLAELRTTEDSIIRKDISHNKNLENGRLYWIKKHGAFLPRKPRLLKLRIFFRTKFGAWFKKMRHKINQQQANMK